MSKARAMKITGARTLTSWDICEYTGNYGHTLMVYIGNRFCGYTRLN